MASTSPSEPVIPYGRQSISDADVAAVVEVLRSDFLTQGPAVPAFEAAVAERCGAPHAVAVNSATSALHLACLALDLGPGDRLWTAPITFVASANAARFCGATVEFVDVDPETALMSVQALEEKLREARRRDALPKVVMPVHYAGASCDMAAIGRLAGEYGFAVIEDAAHAIGGSVGDTPVGACTHSDVTVFSFHPVKIVTTGEGGLALTRRAELAERMARLRSHGVTRDSAGMAERPDGGWAYDQVELGFNYRMTDLQAALGRSQLSRLATWVSRRAALARRYDGRLADLPMSLPRVPEGVTSAWHLYVVRVAGDAPRDRRGLYDGLRAAGIGVNVHYRPVYLNAYWRALGHRPGECPTAELFYGGALTLPLFPLLGEPAQDRVVEAVTRLLG